ncbi:MAG TPA: serine hydrolase [Chitinophagaceae bacterium]
MKKMVVILLFPFLSQFALAQDIRQIKTDSVCSLVKQYFNQKNINQLYELTGKNFKNSLSQEAFTNICNNNLFPLGELKETVFESYEDGVAKYKAVFNSVNLTLLLSLDENDKIVGFLFKPYNDEKAKKNDRVLSTNPLSTALDKEVDLAVQPYMSLEATVGLSVGILKNGKTFFYNYGETARGNKQLPDQHTLFEIGSLSKTFTTILLADAVNDGKAKLDDPINRYLPDSIPLLQYEETPITILTLANHSSGLPRMPSNFRSKDPSDPFADYGNNDLFSFYHNFKPLSRPGDKYEYSNLAVGTLGVIIERIDQSNYEKLIEEKICKPLNMNETKEYLTKSDSTRFAWGYNEEGTYNSPWNFKALAGAGAIRSSVSDLLKYANANLGDAPPKLNNAILLTHQITLNKGGTKVGLAWHFIKPGNDDLIFHNGETGGYHSYLSINPSKKFAVVILSNCAKGTENVGNSLMKWLEEFHPANDLN